MAERTITVGSASKELRLIGWRVGWIVAPVPLLPDLALVSMGNVVVPVGIGQAAAAVALEAGDDDVARATATWQARRDLILSELAGLPVIRPGGGWSLLIDGKALGMTGAAMSRRLFDGPASPPRRWTAGARSTGPSSCGSSSPTSRSTGCAASATRPAAPGRAEGDDSRL